MDRQRNILGGLAFIIALLAIVIFVVLPMVIEATNGDGASIGIFADIGLGVIVVGAVVLILGAVPFITAVTASQARNNRIKRDDKSDDQKHG